MSDRGRRHRSSALSDRLLRCCCPCCGLSGLTTGSEVDSVRLPYDALRRWIFSLMIYEPLRGVAGSTTFRRSSRGAHRHDKPLCVVLSSQTTQRRSLADESCNHLPAARFRRTVSTTSSCFFPVGRGRGCSLYVAQFLKTFHSSAGMADPYHPVVHRDNRQFNKPTIRHSYHARPFASSDKWPEPQPWAHSTRPAPVRREGAYSHDS